MKRICTILLFAIGTVAMAGGQKKMTPQEYIANYKDEAIKEMKRTGIPASITLSQGMLESSYGNSYLARKANNHFGIKCHSDWKGAKVFKDDDAKDECFRKYKNALASFKDHSDFLTNRKRYAFLFQLKPTDYKAWAKGLKKAGYATNPKYPSLLINLIEKYSLNQYDSKKRQKKKVNSKKKKKGKKETESDFNIKIKSRIQLSDNYVKFIEVQEGEGFESLSKITGVSVKRLMKYNERTYKSVAVGEKIYIQPKKKRAKLKYYTVKKVDTLYRISQQFGVSVKSIVKRNRLQKEESVRIGQQLKLKGRKVKL